jgi:hypothetical protein
MAEIIRREGYERKEKDCAKESENRATGVTERKETGREPNIDTSVKQF